MTWSLEHGLVPLFKFCVTVSVLYITTALIHLQQSYHYNQGWKLHSSSHCFRLTLRSSVSKPRHFKQMFHRLFSPAADVIKGDCWKIYYEYIWSGVIHLSLMIVKKSFSTSHPTPLNSFFIHDSDWKVCPNTWKDIVRDVRLRFCVWYFQTSDGSRSSAVVIPVHMPLPLSLKIL